MKFKEFPRLSPECKHEVWSVGISETSTTNPMTRKRAVAIFKERQKLGIYAELFKAWSCVEAKNLEKYYLIKSK